MKRKRRNQILPIGHSLSLEWSSNETLINNYSCASIFVQEVPRIIPTRFWHGLHCYICKCSNKINNRLSLTSITNGFEIIAILQTSTWEASLWK